MEKKNIAALFRAYHAAKLAADKAKALSTEIKSAIGAEPTTAGGFTAHVTIVTSERFDTARFKREQPALYAQYCSPQTTERLIFK